jgi:predicted transcriptional regulator
MTDSIGTLFFKDKQVKLILTLSNGNKEWHLTELSKEANVTYIHTSKFISKCEAYGLVATEKHGRIKRLYLTEKGKEIVKGITSMMEKVRYPEPPQQQVPKAAPQQPGPK